MTPQNRRNSQRTAPPLWNSECDADSYGLWNQNFTTTRIEYNDHELGMIEKCTYLLEIVHSQI